MRCSLFGLSLVLNPLSIVVLVDTLVMYPKMEHKAMSRDFSLKVRLTEDEKNRLKAEADRRNVTMSEVIQDYCKRLPKPTQLESSVK